MGIDALDWSELIVWADKFYSATDVEWIKPPRKRTQRKVRGKIQPRVPLKIKYCTLPDVDIQIIRQMSQEYCWMASEATDPNCPCPIEVDRNVEISEDEEEIMAQGVIDSLRALGFLGEDGQSI